MQIRQWCELLGTHLELLAKSEGGLVSSTSSGKDFTVDKKGEVRKVWSMGESAQKS